MPFKLSQIKIVKELIEAEQAEDYTLWDNPTQIATNTGLILSTINEYQQYAFNIMYKKNHKSKEKKS